MRRSAFERFRLKLREPTVPDTVVPTLLTTSFTLYGLRHDANIIRELYMSLSRVLEDSTTYQWIIKQGFTKGEAKGKPPLCTLTAHRPPPLIRRR